MRAASPGENGHVAAWALDLGVEGEVFVTRMTARTGTPTRPPARHQLRLWFGPPACDGTVVAAAAMLLDPAEQCRAGGFAHAADRASYVTAHAMARALLGGALGCAPADVRIRRDGYGKPHAAMPDGGTAPLHFSISHTRGFVAVALAGCPVGIDVESARAAAAVEKLAPDVLSTGALAALHSVEARHRGALFLRYWTLAEALVKATGRGLAQDLRGFTFTPSGEPRLLGVEPCFGPAERWRFGAL